MSQAKAGDPAAWEVLFRRYQLPLYVYVFEMLHEQQASLDVVQETFISAIRHIGGLREDEKFGSWLFGVAHQKCIQHWRKEDRRGTAFAKIQPLPDEVDESPLDLLIREEDEERFMTYINQLPPVLRSVVLLHFVEEFSLVEIAEITESPLGTVKSRLHYAKKALRTTIQENEP